MLQSLVLALAIGSHPVSVNENLAFGAPSAAVAGHTQLLVRKGFVLMHDNDRKVPLWVAFRLKKEYISNNPREGSFEPDPDLASGDRAELADYRNSGFDRGHMAASGDMRRSDDIQAETFYLSNIIPQNGVLNRGIWAQLEALYRSYAIKNKDVTIYVGPIFTKPFPSNFSSLPQTIGSNHVAVPTWVYRIVVRKLANGHYDALAIEMPNGPVPKTNGLDQYIVSVRQVERDTGLNFCNALPSTEQNRFETRKPAHVW